MLVIFRAFLFLLAAWRVVWLRVSTGSGSGFFRGVRLRCIQSGQFQNAVIRFFQPGPLQCRKKLCRERKRLAFGIDIAGQHGACLTQGIGGIKDIEGCAEPSGSLLY